MNRCKHYLQTSCLIMAFTSLVSCGSSPQQTARPHPYESSLQLLENLAQQAIEANQFNKAANLYGQAFDRYNAINDTNGVWRSGLNQLQMLIIVEAWPQALDKINTLNGFTQFSDNTPSRYSDQLHILQSHIAIARQEWQQAEALLSKVNQNTTIKAINLAIIAVKTGAADAQDRIDRLKATNLSGFEQARLWRLEAELSSSDINAERYLTQALQVYQAAYYLPGTHAVYKQLAQRFADTPKGHWYQVRYHNSQQLLTRPQ